MKLPIVEILASLQGEGKACGKCPTCQERLGIFEELNMKDPCEYV